MDVNKLKSGSIGLSYPMLSKDNYIAWSMKMKFFMQARGSSQNSNLNLLLGSRPCKWSMCRSVEREVRVAMYERE